MNQHPVLSTLRHLSLTVIVALTVCGRAEAVDLPQACAAGLCGVDGPAALVSQGAAALTQTLNSLTITQTTPTALLNWQSFNISADGTVNFVQPSSSSVALNRIFQADASRIFGHLNANGTVYLLNQNGFLFGQSAVVNVGGLLASSLNITPDALQYGIGNASQTGSAAFQPYTDRNGAPLTSGNITVAHGASIDAPGGQVMLFAPNVENGGHIATPDGQTIIGAGERVFLAVSSDPNVRGLLVEVGNGGTATNDGVLGAAGGMGEIIANRGNVTIAGLAVNQNGRVSASTSTRVNGSIYLQARDTTASQLSIPGRLQVDRTGTLDLGAASVTEVTLDNSTTETAVDATPQSKSQINLSGQTVILEDASRVVATSGNVDVQATARNVAAGQADPARIVLGKDSLIDVSGAIVSLPVERNSLAVQLRGSQLADNPQQRNGALRGLTVYVDIRNHGTDANGNTWVGSQIGDLTGDISTIKRDVYERNLTGGTVNLNSTGAVFTKSGSKIDVSGGQIDWQSGYVKTSVLLGANGIVYDISTADPNRAYVGTLDSVSESDPHWGTTVTAASFGRDPRGRYVAGYVEGKDAGSVTITAPAMVLDGTFAGQATAGLLQRNLPGAIPTGALYRWADQAPLGGLLTLGNSQGVSDREQTEILQSLMFSSTPTLPTLTGASGGAFDPLHDVLPSDYVSVLHPSVLGGSAMSRLAVYAMDGITVPADVHLTADAGGSVSLTAGRVTLDGTVAIPAGVVTLAAVPTDHFDGNLGKPLPGLTLGAAASINAAGEWINDSPAVTVVPSGALYTSGGKVTLSSTVGSLSIPSGVSIDVSGGAQMTLGGTVVPGAGGAISVTQTVGPYLGAPNASTLFAPTMTGYALRNGGSLSVLLPAECLSDVGCADPLAVDFPSYFLDSLGFGNIALGSTASGFEVDGAINAHVLQNNLQLLPAAFRTARADSLQGLAQVVQLPDYQRVAANLTLSSAVGIENTLAHGDLVVSGGAQIQTDALGSITLKSRSRIFEDGSLIAPGGSIKLDLVPNSELLQFEPTQAIWVGENALIDVSGAVVYTPNLLGLKTGKVYAGGTVSLLAEGGYLVVQPGATIAATGAAGEVDIRESASSAAYSRYTVASAGGAVNLFAAEGLQFDGTLYAQGGDGGSATHATAPGGTLTVTLNGSFGTGAARSTSIYPIAPRVLTVNAADTPLDLVEGDAIPAGLNGLGRIDAQTITDGGFDQIKLTSANLLASSGGSPFVAAPGSVVFEAGATLAPRIGLWVNAPTIAGTGAGDVHLSSGYVALGSSDVLTQATSAPGIGGATTLRVDAGLMDLVGAFGLSGFSNATLASSGDIRAVGVQLQGTTAWNGRLTSGGALDLVAQQIYPAMLSSYTIAMASNDPVLGRLSIEQAPGTPGSVYSAAGTLNLQAAQIDDAGTVRAPFGSITMTAPTINLLAGSTTSVSGQGLDVLFGETQGGLDWIYPLTSQITTVYGTGSGAILPPQKRLTLTGNTVNLATGSTIDVSGGGELTAFEFTAGVGGTRDVLSNLVSPNLYAVIPGAQLSAAPIDPLNGQGANLSPGASVYLAGGNGLPAGVYTLLPARYALLPGAYLVSAVSGYTDLSLKNPLKQFDGSVIVAGYRVYGGTGLGDTRTSGFAIQPGSYALKQANYTLTSADAFFTNQAAANGTPAARLPADAGSLAINAALSVVLEGVVNGSHHGAGTRGAAVDLSSTNLYVGADASAAPTGYVTLDSNQLNGLGAESLLLGGVRTPTAAGAALTVGATNVVVGADAQLTGQEILLAASGSVEMMGGASVASTGTAVTTVGALSLASGTALIRTSTGAQQDLSIVGTGGSGRVLVDAGSTLAGTGSIAFNSGGIVNFAGALNAPNASVRLSATNIGIGVVPSGFNGFVLSPTLLAGLGTSNLELSSPNGVQYFGDSTLSLGRLALIAPGLSAVSGASLAIDANDVLLGGPTNTPLSGVAGTGSLAISTGLLELGGGAFGVSGVSQTTIDAAQGVVARADTALSTTGALAITTPVLTTAGAYDVTLSSVGAMSLSAPAATPTSTPVSQAGGRYQLAGSSVLIDTAIRLPGGVVVANATNGDVTLGSSSVVDVSGFKRTFDGLTVSANGGTVALSANHGNVNLDSGSQVDVSAGAGTGRGGSLSVTAADGAVTVAGTVRGAGSRGANLLVDAQSVDETAVWALNADAGFTGDVTVRKRGAGDLSVASGTTLRTGDLSLTADQGSVRVAGVVNAQGAQGHTVTLAAQGDVVVDGTIAADATGSATRGGTVNLLSAQGGVYVNAGATVSVGGHGGTAAAPTTTNTGTVWVRLPAANVLSVLAGDPATAKLRLDGNITGDAHLTVEGYQAYTSAGTIGAAQVAPTFSNVWYRDASNFMANASTLTTLLGRDADPAFSIIPGIDVRTTGDLHLAADWDLSSWRFGDYGTTPGALTLRVGGSLYADRSLSDGFYGVDPSYSYYLSQAFGPSWSYRLTAGADSSSANPLAVTALDRLGVNAGDLVVAAGKPSDAFQVNGPTVIRTGTGSIDIAAARDVKLTNQASVIYTAGDGSLNGLPLYDNDSGIQGLAYPYGGGNVTITAGRDVIGANSNQLFNDWLWRSGVTSPEYAPSAWLVSYGNFEQGIGAFGGGDVTVTAARNIVDLGANVTTTGVPMGDGTAKGTHTDVWGSGVLTVAAGGDIRGGKFLGMADGASLTAAGAITIGSTFGRAAGTAPVLALAGDAFNVYARRTASIETVVNPTLLPRSLLQPVGNRIAGQFYSTYTDASAVSVTSAGGNVVFLNRTGATDALAGTLANVSFNGFFSGYGPALRTYAPTLTAAALSGDVVVQQSFDMAPSAHGTLNLLASGSVLMASPSGRGAVRITQSDLDPASLGTVDAPGTFVATLGLLDISSMYTPGAHAPQAVHGGAYASDGLADLVPNRIVALNGDVAMQPTDISNPTVLVLAKPVDVTAGRDIRDLGLNVQNVSEQSVDAIVAGRDIIYDAGRTPSGVLVQNARSVDVAGPGAVLVQAGRTLNLQTSYGITTSGNLSNNALPADGASISVVTGVGPNGPHYADFINSYVVQSDAYAKDLLDYLQALTGTRPATRADALATFAALPASEQTGFVRRVFVDELRAGGRSAAAAGPGHNDFSRAFKALDTLFPGSNPDLTKGEKNPYSGDILLYFSRIYTLAGGDIDLYAPGGQINVGLAAAPSTFGIAKTPSQLGIVAQGTGSVTAVAYSDVQVNQSRVFAANGGNILIWSTEGDIDAGRGAKTAISAPPPVIRVDANGQVTSVFPAALTGSGIQTIATSKDLSPGDVDLFAPHGVVNANDAGIVAGNLTIAATAVLGANNISFSGTAVGVPVQTTGLGVSMAAASSSSTAAGGLGSTATEGGEKAGSRNPMAEAALNWLEVFVVGLGEENCKPDDMACLQRQKH